MIAALAVAIPAGGAPSLSSLQRAIDALDEERASTSQIETRTKVLTVAPWADRPGDDPLPVGRSRHGRGSPRRRRAPTDEIIATFPQADSADEPFAWTTAIQNEGASPRDYVFFAVCAGS